MPLVFRQGGFRFHFYSNEGDPLEPVHIHVTKDGADAKFWVQPAVELAYNRGFNAACSASSRQSSRNVARRSRGPGMTISARATEVRFDDDQMWIDLDDGRTIGVPLAWFPRLLHGSPADRAKVTISPSGLHWEELDEDISIAGLLQGRGDATRTPRRAA